MHAVILSSTDTRNNSTLRVFCVDIYIYIVRWRPPQTTMAFFGNTAEILDRIERLEHVLNVERERRLVAEELLERAKQELGE